MKLGSLRDLLHLQKSRPLQDSVTEKSSPLEWKIGCDHRGSVVLTCAKRLESHVPLNVARGK